MSSRTFLFLQGVATPFFKELAEAIQQNGHQVYKVNFCGGDRLFSGRIPAWRFNQPLEQLPAWLEAKHTQHRFTDVVLFGDTRPVHTYALPTLRRLGLRVHVYEEGYFRPNWITLESNGVNGYSQLLQQNEQFWQQQRLAGTPIKTFSSLGRNMPARAFHDICYRLANLGMKPLYSKYRSHRPFMAGREYLGWSKRMPTNKLWREAHEKRKIERLIASAKPFYLLPLQLDSDSQIRVHSNFSGMAEVIELVLRSFAAHAPADSILVIKNHPLDTGILKHGKTAKRLAKSLGIESRLLFLETGHLPTLLQHTKGTVLVNSTTGTSAIYHGSPTIALGTAIFNRPGLTFSGSLDDFWTQGQPADPEVFNQFYQTVVALTQINGDFYLKAGRRMAIEGSLKAMHIAPVPSTATIDTDDSEELLTPMPIYGGSLPEKAYRYKEL